MEEGLYWTCGDIWGQFGYCYKGGVNGDNGNDDSWIVLWIYESIWYP